MIIVLTGAPGAGKGTQAELLAEKCHYRKVSTGDSLRKHVKEKTKIGQDAAVYMDAGNLVPDDVLFEILLHEIGTKKDEKIILDGYPRNVDQAKTLSDKLAGTHAVVRAIHLDVNKDQLTKRLSGRRTCQDCGASYHIEANPPSSEGVCDRCGGQVIRRSDDSPDKVANRLDVYENKTKPVLDFYKDRGLFVKVDGAGSTQEVFNRLKNELAAACGG